MGTEEVDLLVVGYPVMLRYERHGLRTIWKTVLLAYLNGPIGESMRANDSAVGSWATYRNHPYNNDCLTKMRRRFERFGWEFKPDHRCPFCLRGRTRKLPRVARVSQNEHEVGCKWSGMRWDQLWVTFRKVGAASPELEAEGLAYLNRKSNRKARVKSDATE